MVDLKIDFAGKCPVFSSSGFTPQMDQNADFWRIHLDTGELRELGVYSSAQTPLYKKQIDENQYEIKYEELISENGDIFNICLTVFIENKNGKICYKYKIENNSNARVNEIQLPVCEFLKIAEHEEEECLYIPSGLGSKILNPRKFIQKNCHTEYMGADYKNIWMISGYPNPEMQCAKRLSMCWLGLQYSDKFLYFSSEDIISKIVNISVGTGPRNTASKLIFAVSHFPAAVKGETIISDESVFAVFNGDWKKGADYYRSACERIWLKDTVKSPEWVKNMTGWQRIILKHQYGEILYKYSDIPRLYKKGEKFGLNTILVFGWWKGRFDNNYPEYEPDPLLGGEEELKRAIKEVSDMGGHVLLYSNGNLIDIKTNFYKNIGKDCCSIDIDGNEYREHYRFSNNGTLLRSAGYKSFVTGCHTTKEWKTRLLQTTSQKLSYGADSVFFDQLGVCCKLCFNSSHPHGNRIDTEPQSRVDNAIAIKNMLNENQALGTEWFTDRFVLAADYIHGCGESMTYTKDAFPDIVLHTFPECRTSNRFIHDEKDGYKKHLNYCFVYNMIFDVSIYRGRGDFSDCPEYGNYVKYLLDMRYEYKNFFVGGNFFSCENLTDIENVFAAGYENNGKKIIALCNNSDIEAQFKTGKSTIILKPDEVKVIEV